MKAVKQVVSRGRAAFLKARAVGKKVRRVRPLKAVSRVRLAIKKDLQQDRQLPRVTISDDVRSHCEDLAVGVARTANYRVLFDEFCEWLASRNVPHPTRVATAQPLMLEYLDVLMLGDCGLDDARSSMAAIKHHFPYLAGPICTPRVARALKGYTKRYPPRARAPMGREPTAAITQILKAWGFHDAAVQIATSFATYLRPGPLRKLKVRDLLPPVRDWGPLSVHQLHIAPLAEAGEEQDVTKTGTIDEGVPLDGGWQWLGTTLEQLAYGKAADEAIFTTPPAQMVELFGRASKALKLPKVVLYMLRHGGASEDLLSGARSEAEIMQRGHWKTATSVRRYAKKAQLQKLLAKMSPEHREYGTNSWNLLPEILQGSVPAVLPEGFPSNPADVNMSHDELIGEGL
jgi:hypothetical protein